jgi:hypothetical protein
LVLKSDNGSAFIAEIFAEFLHSWGVVQLFSPARHPQYNGALERSNGTLKTYTQQHAIREGHPFRWTSEDVEQARQLANTLSRPWGHRGPTPEEAWQARATITDEDRQTFLETVARHQLQARADLGLDDKAALDRKDQSRLDRLAVSRALIELDYLQMNRVPRPPKKAKRLSRGELTRRALRHRATPDVPRLTYQPSVPSSPPAETPSCAPRCTVASQSESKSRFTAPFGAAESCLTVRRPAADVSPPVKLGTPACDIHSALPDGTVTKAINKHSLQGATLSAVSIAPAPSAAASREQLEKPPASLAVQAHRDTMREQASVAGITPLTPSTPESAQGERSHTSWFRRSITLIIRLAKTAIISRV